MINELYEIIYGIQYGTIEHVEQCLNNLTLTEPPNLISIANARNIIRKINLHKWILPVVSILLHEKEMGFIKLEWVLNNRKISVHVFDNYVDFYYMRQGYIHIIEKLKSGVLLDQVEKQLSLSLG